MGRKDLPPISDFVVWMAILGGIAGYMAGFYLTVALVCSLGSSEGGCIPIHAIITLPLSTYFGVMGANRLARRHERTKKTS